MSDDGRRPFVIYYIANGHAVSHQNKGRVVGFLGDQQRKAATATPDRLSLIAVAKRLDNPVLIYALTPATSFPGARARLSGGRKEERAFLKVLLERTYPAFARDVDPDILRLSARGSWDWAVADAETKLTPMPSHLHQRFREALAAEFGEPVRAMLDLAVQGLVQQRDPIQTAKLVASIDQVSNGRFLFGVGGGWNADEMENHGTEFKTRFKLMRERIEAMKEIWTKSKAQYHGDMVNFDEVMAWPKPVQRPHPPIIVGGAFPQAARRAIRYGDGWCPIGGRPGSDPLDALEQFRQMARDAGRDPQSLPITLFNPAEDPDQLARYRDMGVARVVVMLLSEPSDKILPILDRWTPLIRRTA
jgi:probable F420-dependent oxidoreductase